MYRFVILGLFFAVTSLDAQEIPLYNGSFEDIPRQGGAISRGILGWNNCGTHRGGLLETPPDIHAGGESNSNFFDVTVAPKDGKTYLGMVARENETFEAVSQPLIEPLLPKKCYAWRVYLCKAPTYNSATNLDQDVIKSFTRPIVLRIYGGNSSCDRGELLAESVPISNTDWQEYAFTFKPTKMHRFILLEAFYKTPVLVPYNGNILFDGASSIIEMECAEDPARVVETFYENKEAISDSGEDVARNLIINKPPAKEKPAVSKPVEQSAPVAKKTTTDKPVAEQPTTPKKPIITDLKNSKNLKKNQVIRVEQLQFPADSFNIEPSSETVLSEVYDFLRKNPRVRIEVRGHTNGRPKHDLCDKLSTARAKAVRDYLVEKGISKRRIEYRGYGKRKPIASNATSAGRARNQRVEIKILSLTG